LQAVKGLTAAAMEDILFFQALMNVGFIAWLVMITIEYLQRVKTG
jgi:hypothetical protein